MSSAEPRGSDHGDLADRILDAAQRLLFRTGARKLSLSDVATLAGVSRPTIYRYFASKEDLIDAMGKRERRRFATAMDKAMSGVVGVARLEAAVDVVATFLEAQPPGRLLDLEPGFAHDQMAAALPMLAEGLVAVYAALRPRGRPRRGGGSPRPCRRDRANRLEPLHISRVRPRRGSPTDPCRRRSFRPRLTGGLESCRGHQLRISSEHVFRPSGMPPPATRLGMGRRRCRRRRLLRNNYPPADPGSFRRDPSFRRVPSSGRCRHDGRRNPGASHRGRPRTNPRRTPRRRSPRRRTQHRRRCPPTRRAEPAD